MATSTQERNCLICEVPISDCHLGIDSCRACAVFYKRVVSSNRELKCKGGRDDCIQENPTTACRKCRFQRFSEIYAKASESVEEIVIEKERKISGERKNTLLDTDKDSLESEFIDHDSYSHCTPSSSSETPILDRVRQAYSMVCKIRKSGEFGTYTGVGCNDAVGKGKLVFFPSTYSRAIPNARIFYSAIIEFGDAAFEDYRNLDHEIKAFIANTTNNLFAALDSAYRAARYFPDEDTIFTSYTATLNIASVESFFDDCSHEINLEEAAKEMRKNILRSEIPNKALFIKFRPTDKEFLALICLSLWNNDIFTLNESLMSIVTKNREAILKELHVMYRNQGIIDYATRLGELLCLLVNIEKKSFYSKEEIEVYRLMNLFNEAFDDID